MNAASIDALALAQAARERAQLQASRAPFPALGPSMLADPNLVAALAARRASMPMYPYSSSVQLERPIGGGGIDDAVYLSLLDRQRRLQSAQSLLDPVKPNVGVTPPMAAPSPHIAEAMVAGPHASAPPSGPASPPPSRRRKPNFAEKLHAALSDRDSFGAATWLPSGRSFCIVDQGEFVKRVLPRFFREAKFESFARRLKRWGFRKVYEAGIHRTVFAHDLFRRDRPDLCAKMNGRDRATRASKGSDSPPPKPLPAELQGKDPPPSAQLRLAQQQILRQMSQQSSVLDAAQPRDPSPRGVEGSLAQAVMNEAMARANNSPSQVNPGSAMLAAAAQPQRHSPPGAGGPLAQAMVNEAMARANNPQAQVNSRSAMLDSLAAAQRGRFPSAGGSLAQAAMNEAMAREAMARAVDPRARVNPGSAILAAAQLRGLSFPGAGGSLAEMARAKDPRARVSPEDTDEIRQARVQLDRLSDDIANYNGQLAILQQLREAKSLGS